MYARAGVHESGSKVPGSSSSMLQVMQAQGTVQPCWPIAHSATCGLYSGRGPARFILTSTPSMVCSEDCTPRERQSKRVMALVGSCAESGLRLTRSTRSRSTSLSNVVNPNPLLRPDLWCGK